MLGSPSMPHFTCDVYVRVADGQVLTQPYTAPTKRGIARYLDSRYKSPQAAFDIAKTLASEIQPYGWAKAMGYTRFCRFIAAWNIPGNAPLVQSSNALTTSRGILIRNSTFGNPEAVERNRSIKFEDRHSSIRFVECAKTSDIPLGKYIPSRKRTKVLPKMLAKAAAQEKEKSQRENLNVQRIIEELEKVLEDVTADDQAYFDSVVEAGTPPRSGAETPASPLTSSANSSCDSLSSFKIVETVTL